MLLRPVNTADLAVAAGVLIPQLLLQTHIIRTLLLGLFVGLYIIFQLPLQIIRERYLTCKHDQPAFTREASAYEFALLRVVRYAATKAAPDVTRAFFSNQVWYPFLRWRMMRHGLFSFPTHVEECKVHNIGVSARGTWIKRDPKRAPDVVVYYIHGGGFVMAGVGFYLEILLAMHQRLIDAGFTNPAIFAIEYTLAPDKKYPTQILEVLQGYRMAVEAARDASKVVVAGDSAGGALTLSLMLEIASQNNSTSTTSTTTTKSQRRRSRQPNVREESPPLTSLAPPRLAVLMSPWVTLRSDLHKNTDLDYVTREPLCNYARIYAGEDAMMSLPPASPGACRDDALWKAASPEKGYYVTWGQNEMLAGDIEDWVGRQKACGVKVKAAMDSGVHVTPIVSMMLSTSKERVSGIDSVVKEIRNSFGRK